MKKWRVSFLQGAKINNFNMNLDKHFEMFGKKPKAITPDAKRNWIFLSRMKICFKTKIMITIVF